jgi:diketogulonate reductase-like aldo/keto reductase
MTCLPNELYYTRYDEESTGNGVAEFVDESGVSISEITIVTKIHPRSYSLEKMQAAVNQSKRLLYHDEHAVLDAVLLHAPFCWQGHCTAEEEKVRRTFFLSFVLYTTCYTLSDCTICCSFAYS